MVAQPASVPAVRRFVDDALTLWGRTDLVDDVGLSVTELATNATLHSQSTFFDVELSADDGAVRVAVVDTGAVSATSIASRAEFEHDAVNDPDLDFESMTGRGLFIVSALASCWGIDDLPGGTRVWAAFAIGDRGYVAQPPVVVSAPELALPLSDGPTAVIRLVGCPPDLLLAHDDNLADIARELKLFGASHADRQAVQTAEQIVEIVRLSALSWDAARLVAQHAVREGLSSVDIAIAVTDPADLPNKVQLLRRAILAAEAMADQGLLMTMPAAAPVQEWRDWVEAEMTQQATSGRGPVSLRDYREFR